jgi:hypothetical protein
LHRAGFECICYEECLSSYALGKTVWQHEEKDKKNRRIGGEGLDAVSGADHRGDIDPY